MPSFDHRHYVPFLKAKEGELVALGQVDVADRDRLTPLLEVGPVEVDPKTGAAVETIDEALKGLVPRIARHWGKIDECFLDLPNFRLSGRLESGAHPVAAVFAETRAAELIAIPVTGLNRGQAYQQAITDVVSVSRKGVAIRLRRSELADLGTLGARLGSLCSELGVEPADADLILDFGEVRAGIEKEVRHEAEAALRGLPVLGAWRSLTFGVGAFPAQPSALIDAGDSGPLPRRDWALWRELIALTDPPLPRKPAFGDYGITHPSWLQYDPLKMTRTAGIRYTIDRDWLVLRGRSLEKPGAFAQFHGLSRDLKGHKEFAGADHCWGDQEIRDCSGRRERPGSLTTWRAIGTRHHLCVVDRALASQP
jgi:hypothetical protein